MAEALLKQTCGESSLGFANCVTRLSRGFRRGVKKYAGLQSPDAERVHASMSEAGRRRLSALLTTSHCARLAINDLAAPVELKGATLMQHLLQLLASALHARFRAGE
jgi:hypothetical protein